MIYPTVVKGSNNKGCEVGLNAYQFCNLTEINGGSVLDQADLNARAKAASFIGTLQAGYTDFHYLRDCWKDQTEEEALIGVGITGIGDGKLKDLDLTEAAGAVVYENGRVATYIGINPAPRSTVVKPAGTSSLALGTASGVHAWHDEFFIRHIRVGKYEAIYDYLALYLPELIEDDVMDDNLAVLKIPMKAPKTAILRSEKALDLLERVKRYNTDWVRAAHTGGNNTNNVSCTINLREDEWDEAGDWMYDNRNIYNGIAVLPADDHTYPQAPFTTCTEAEYERLLPFLGNIDLNNVFEKYDNTDHKAEAACAGGNCDIQ